MFAYLVFSDQAVYKQEYKLKRGKLLPEKETKLERDATDIATLFFGSTNNKQLLIQLFRFVKVNNIFFRSQLPSNQYLYSECAFIMYLEHLAEPQMVIQLMEAQFFDLTVYNRTEIGTRGLLFG